MYSFNFTNNKIKLLELVHMHIRVYVYVQVVRTYVIIQCCYNVIKYMEYFSSYDVL